MDNTILLYHGSQRIIDRPHIRGGKPYNDYGYGFYCTEHVDIAREWAVEKERDGFCNMYGLDMSGLVVFNLNNGEYTILHWLSVLLENRRFEASSALAREGRAYITRHFQVDYHSADVIRGYRADDSYFSFASDFLNGTISVRQLEEAMYLGMLGEQIVLKSERAFLQCIFRGYEAVGAQEWFAKKEKRDRDARRQYRERNKADYVRGDLYLPMLIDGEVGPDDTRVRRIVS